MGSKFSLFIVHQRRMLCWHKK